MLKKIISMTLMLSLILSSTISVYANQSSGLPNNACIESYVVFDEEYIIYSNILKDGR